MTNKMQALQKLEEYEKKIQDTEYEDVSDGSKISYQVRVHQSTEDLQNSITRHQVLIEKVRLDHVPLKPTSYVGHQLKSTNQPNLVDQPSVDPRQRLQQLRNIKAAYETLAPQEPYLPFPDSALPALLALRNCHRIVVESKTSIRITHERLNEVQEQLSREEANLKDARLITESLEKRIETLRQEYEEQSQKSPEEAAKAMIQEQASWKSDYETETKKLIRALVKFINEHLARMLAAEELGGPVVGDLLNVTDDMLVAGFNLQGKAKKAKAPSDVVDSKRQRRIDQIWGHQDEDVEDFQSERTAAAAEMRSLIEELLNIAVEGGSQNTYILLQRDSAAARFLVRAKVARFHPRDARKLRLINFSQDLDD